MILEFLLALTATLLHLYIAVNKLHANQKNRIALISTSLITTIKFVDFNSLFGSVFLKILL